MVNSYSLWKTSLVGQRFERLVVKKQLPNKHGARMWGCKCDCGKSVSSPTSALRHGNTKSCGCWRRDRMRKVSTKHGQSETTRWNLWSKAKKRAKKKGFVFSLTLSDIPKLPEICPMLGLRLMEHHDGKPHPNSYSLDRIDSGRGYVPDNIQIVSHRANILKNNASSRELFLIANFMENR